MLEKLNETTKAEVECKRINIDESIRELRKKFLEIKNMGYVKSVRSGSTGIGATFESLIGKTEDKLEIPDFKGIELKTRRGYSKSLMNLFNASPKGNDGFGVREIRDRYGYPDKKDKNLKRFGGHIYADKKVKVGLFYRFQLRIDRKNKKVILCVYDWNDVCVDESSYWDFEVLREKLIRKLSVLALIKAWPNRIGGVEYFKYYKMTIYVLRDFESFLKALEDGNIVVSFKIGNHYEKDRYGEVQAHGVSFAIAEKDIDKVFEYYR